MARIQVEAHLVDDLKAGLLIGIDVMGREGFKLDFSTRVVKIGSFMGMAFLIAIYAKPHHRDERAVYTRSAFIIPAHTHARIPVRLTDPYLDDKDYIFQG